MDEDDKPLMALVAARDWALIDGAIKVLHTSAKSSAPDSANTMQTVEVLKNYLQLFRENLEPIKKFSYD